MPPSRYARMAQKPFGKGSPAHWRCKGNQRGLLKDKKPQKIFDQSLPFCYYKRNIQYV